MHATLPCPVHVHKAIVLALYLVPGIALAQPANDNPCSATVLPVNSNCVNTSGTNVSATGTAGIPAPGCAGYNGGDVWYQVTVPAAGQVTVTTSTSGGFNDSGMAFYTAASCAGPFTLVSCNNDIVPVFNRMSTLTYTGAPGIVLWVRVWENGNNQFGTFNICATAPPAFDNPCGATTLTVGAACAFTTYSNAGTTTNGTLAAPGCGAFGAGSLDVWFSFVAPPTGMVIIETQAGSMTDAAMALYYDDPPLGCAGPFTLVQCDDDSGPGLMPFLTFINLVPGGTYYLRLWGYGSSTGTFGLCVHAPASMPAGQCVYMLELFDSYGDGWGSSNVGVSINGAPATTYSVSGSYNIVLIGLNVGQVLAVSYTATGPNQTQNSYVVGYYPGGTTIFSSGTPPAAGTTFTQTITCQPPPASQSDCLGGTTVCSSQTFTNNANSSGNTIDLNTTNRGCLASGERQGTWYYFSPSVGGTIGFTIAPTVAATDYDFAVWGPMGAVTCPPPGPPLRCSYSGLTGNTGLGNGATDLSEGAAGDKWVNTITATAGQVFILYVDNFSTNGQSFTLSWQLSGGASLDCTVLPVELLAFSGRATAEGIELEWSTATELHNDRFEVERGADTEHFAPIGSLPGAGTSHQRTDYRFLDGDPLAGMNYYRLQQVDADGHAERSAIISVRYLEGTGQVVIYPNPGTDVLHIIPSTGLVPARYMLCDAMGRPVLEGPLSSGPAQVRTGSIPQGVYAVKLLDAIGHLVHRQSWVKQ